MRQERWRVNGVELAVRATGDGPLVVLAHGFPDLGISWRLQVDTLVAAGYRVVVPDLRGYGGSDRPADAAAYSARQVGLDLIGLLDREGAERAHVVGHDWGAACVWRLGQEHPDRLLSLTGLSVPHGRPASGPPIEILRSRLGEDFYQVRFQDDAAIVDLEQDVARSLAAAFNDRFDDIGRDIPAAPPHWMPDAVFDHYADAFSRSGFRGGVSYYRNIDANWRRDVELAGTTIDCPSLFLTGSSDPVGKVMRPDTAGHIHSDLEVVVVDGAGHWVHQEKPIEVNRELLAHFERSTAA